MPNRARALVWFSLASLAAAQPSLDRLQNGDGEQLGASRGQSRGQAMHALTAWQQDGDGWVAQTSGWGGIRAVRGEVFLRANRTEPGPLWQEVEFAAAKPRALLLSGYLAGGRDRDRLELTLELLDGDGEVLRAEGSGEVGGAAWTRVWVALALDDALAARAARARVRLTAAHREGQYLDAQADALALWAFGLRDDSRTEAELGVALAHAESAQRLHAAASLLAGAGKARGERWLNEQWPTAKDAATRQELLAVAVLGGHREASKLLRAALEGNDDETRALALELLPQTSGIDWRKLASQLAAQPGPARAAALRALVRDDHKDAQRALIAAHEQADADGKLALLRALGGRQRPLDDVYRSVLLPHLTSTAPAELRHAAMQTLGAWRDPRLVQHLQDLLAKEEQRGRRGAWLEACVRLDTAPAIAAVTQFLDKGEARAEAALVQGVPQLQSSAALGWARTTGLAHAHPAVRIAAAELLGQRGSEADAKLLVERCRDADLEVACAAAGAALRLLRGDARDKLLADLEGLPPLAAARALRSAWRTSQDGARRPASPDPKLLAATRALVTAKAAPLRAAAIDCLGADAADLLIPALADPAAQVRAAAHRALALRRDKSSIVALIERLPQETGASQRSACAALEQLTQAGKGQDPAAWQAWWKLAGAEFQVPAKPSKPRPDAPPENATTAARYHGVPIAGDKIVFVIDLSGSMREVMPGRSETKLQLAQRELIQVLGALGPQRAFDIVVFGDDATAFAGELVKASPEKVADASKWVERLTTRGFTNLWAGLSRALATPDVDAIYLLSDGAPSIGRYVAAGAIRAQVRLRNAEVLATIHTIALGGDRRDRAFLDALAREHGGQSHEAK